MCCILELDINLRDQRVDKRWHYFILGVADSLNGFAEAMKVSKSGLAASSCSTLME